MKVRTAAFLFATLIFGLFTLLGISLVKITSLLNQGAMELAMAAESISVAKELRYRLLIHNRNTFFDSLHQDQDPSRSTTRQALQMEIADLLALMKQLVNSEEAGLALAELKTEIATYVEKLERLETSPFSAMKQYNELSQDVDKLLPIVNKLIAANQSHMNLLTESINLQNKMADKIGVLLLSLGGFVLLSLMAMMFFYIAQPLRTVATTISKFSSGASSARIELGGLTEIRQIGSNFNSMADRLAEKQREQFRFIAAIGHDLRNPLNSISIASELLVHKSGQEGRELAGIILRQVKNLDRMVGDLLDTTRIETGHFDLKFSNQNINSLIMDLVQLHQAGLSLHRFKVELPEEPLFCQCDLDRISQVVNNLISNAVKYSPNGGVVTVRAYRKENEIIISVSDEGIGIEAKDIEHIFIPFRRTSTTRDTIPGIGLGLSASRRIVESHGGKLSVVSKPGTGSTFYFSLPTAKEERPAFQNLMNNSQLPPPNPKTGKHVSRKSLNL